jgi:hypothetical protein
MNGRPGLGPTIGGSTPGPGLRVRLDRPNGLPTGDFDCACGEFAESAVGAAEVQAMTVRAERHMRDTCSNTEVRAAAALRSYRRTQQKTSRKA